MRNRIRSARVRVNGQARLPRRAPQLSPGRHAGGCAAAAFRPLRRLGMTRETAPFRAKRDSHDRAEWVLLAGEGSARERLRRTMTRNGESHGKRPFQITALWNRG